MAYSTGTASSPAGLISALCTFLSNNGWSVWDSLSSTDKVVRSTGEDGEDRIYIRIQDANESGEELLDGSLGYGLSTHDYFATGSVSDRAVISFRAYQNWNNGTHTGQVEQSGRLGRISYWSAGSDDSMLYYNLGQSPTNLDGIGVDMGTVGRSLWNVGYNSTGRYGAYWFDMRAPDMRRAFYASRFRIDNLYDSDCEPGIMIWNPMTYEHYTLYSAGTTFHTYNTFVPAYDGDTLYLYIGSKAASWYWSKWNPADNSFTALTSPGWTPAYSTSYRGHACWDGGDYIYVTRSNYTNFSRYSISGNSWTALAATPEVSRYGNLFYLPASETGHAEDRLYLVGPYGKEVYAYYINGASANTWSANLGDAYAAYGGHALMNGDNYSISSADGSVNTGYYNFLTHTGGSAGTHVPATNYNGGPGFINRYVCDLHVNNGAIMTYHFFCDPHHFKIAVEHDDGKWFWTYAGKIDTFSKSERAKTTAASGTGASVEVPLDSTLTAGVGDYLTLIDVAGDFQDQLQVLESGVNSITLGSVSTSIPSGTLIGEDPEPVGIYSEEAMAWFPTNYPGEIADGVNAFYDVRPLGVPATTFNFLSADEEDTDNKHYLRLSENNGNQRTKRYQLLPAIVSQGRKMLAGMGEIRGQLRGVYISGNDVGDAAIGDTISYEGDSYLVVKPDDGKVFDGYFYCLGPMS